MFACENCHLRVIFFVFYGKFLRNRLPKTLKTSSLLSNILLSNILYTGWKGYPQKIIFISIKYIYIYINDLPDRITSELLLFANDTKLFKEVSTLEDSLMIQSDMYSMDEWSFKFQSIRKSINTYSKEENWNMYLLKKISLLIDYELSFEDHITEKVKKANRILGIIKRSFTYLSPKMFIAFRETPSWICITLPSSFGV